MFSKKSSSITSPPTDKKSGIPSIISANMTVKGDITSTGEVQLEGRLDGNIAARVLIVGKEAHVEGDIAATNVVIHGKIIGDITASQVTLAKESFVDGEIKHENLTIEPGAVFQGTSSNIQGNAPVDTVKDGQNTRQNGADTGRNTAQIQAHNRAQNQVA